MIENYLPYFNSIKVRLELLCSPKSATFSGFQFHKGTIRTHECLLSKIPFSVFQFHKGTIRTDRSGHKKLVHRLFQFHKGTIRTFGFFS